MIRQQELTIEYEGSTHLGMLNRQFHLYIVELADNQHLASTWKSLATQYQAVINYRAGAYPEYDEHQMLSDHQMILDALRTHDPNQVAAVNERINWRVAGQCRQGLITTQ